MPQKVKIENVWALEVDLQFPIGTDIVPSNAVDGIKRTEIYRVDHLYISSGNLRCVCRNVLNQRVYIGTLAVGANNRLTMEFPGYQTLADYLAAGNSVTEDYSVVYPHFNAANEDTRGPVVTEYLPNHT